MNALLQLMRKLCRGNRVYCSYKCCPVNISFYWQECQSKDVLQHIYSRCTSLTSNISLISVFIYCRKNLWHKVDYTKHIILLSYFSKLLLDVLNSTCAHAHTQNLSLCLSPHPLSFKHKLYISIMCLLCLTEYMTENWYHLKRHTKSNMFCIDIFQNSVKQVHFMCRTALYLGKYSINFMSCANMIPSFVLHAQHWS